MNILVVDACVRAESRTRRLADQVIANVRGESDEINTVRLADGIEPIRNERFITDRNKASELLDFSDSAYEYAKQFAKADMIIVAAPYWDLSFPAILKAYFEQINVLGLTFKYTDEGIPQGLCKAKRLIYITTSGGPIISDEYGYGYVRTLAQMFYGIADVSQIKAEGLDIIGADVEKILKEATISMERKG